MALPLSYNLRSLWVRRRVTLLAVGGIALVVAVLVVLVAMAMGFRIALAATGSLDNAIVTQRGSTGELTSGIGRDAANVASLDPRVARDGQGRPLASPELVVVAGVPARAGVRPINVLVRGVTPMAFTVRQGVTIVQGRAFTPGLNEIIVGEQIRDRAAGLEVGHTLRLQRRDWTVVGIFRANRSGFESEIWGDYHATAAAFNRRGGYQSVTVRLQDRSALAAYNADLKRNPHLQVEAIQERRYYENQSGQVSGALLALAVFVAVVMGVGAVFGAMNTMYAIVASRTREIGTLRALGFSRLSILVSFVIESTCLALAGGVLGCVLAWPANGVTSAAGGVNFSEIAFAFRITPAAIVIGLVLALLIGVAGGLLPSLRAARMPITAALREP